MGVGAFICPSCGSGLNDDAEELRCDACGACYPVVDGVHVLLSTGREHPGLKNAQAEWFDHHTDDEWEIERPQGAPPLHRWLLQEKFRRSMWGLADARGRSALVVCGGSGMDAEWLALTGARVVCADISLGAAKRAATRGMRHGFSLTAVVADAERLPFADRSFDLVYVHDGLHHLQRRDRAVAEMARVTREAISINEPAAASVTRWAVRARLAEDVEESGNRVARLRISELTTQLEQLGLTIVHAQRYAMFYRHKPGMACRVLSLPFALPTAKCAIRVGNAAMGCLGNKLAVTAIRTQDELR